MLVDIRKKSKLFTWFDETCFEKWFIGCRCRQLSFDLIVELMYRPTDPSSLGVSRMLFGLLMLIDGAEERGGEEIDLRWGDPLACHFPLLPLPIFSLPYMTIVYGIMWLGALGIALGYMYRISTIMFAAPYWYILLIEKSYWNNHSYLFGLLGILFAGTQANNYMSLDAYLDRSKNGKPIPYWNYFIIKYQLFILYFVAGLKKSDIEWLSGYAMSSISKHWVFDPFKIFLSTELIDYLIVHWFAFVFDLTICFWMMYERTRPVAMLFCASFHLMNSRLFTIGMFPWVCLATMPLFCPPDWPKSIHCIFYKISKVLNSFSRHKMISFVKTKLRNLINVCLNFTSDKSQEKVEFERDEKNNVFDKSCKENDDTQALQSKRDMNSCGDKTKNLCHKDKMSVTANVSKLSNKTLCSTNGNSDKCKYRRNKMIKRKLVVCLLMAHMGIQAFLPYSHFISKGFNNWTNGLYGYSWDMMVHTWDTILVLVKVVDNESNNEVFLDPEAWTPNQRWSKHGDMIYQYAQCLQRNIYDSIDNKAMSREYISVIDHHSNYHDLGCSGNKESCKYFEEQNEKTANEITSKNISIYIDVWCSLNGRFQQRMFNPNVDLLNVKWSPFKVVDWLMPLLTDLNDWRISIADIQKDIFSWNQYSDALFIADFPGMFLENYITTDLSNVSLTVLEGRVFYEPYVSKRKYYSHVPGKSKAVHLSEGESIPVNTGTFHRIHVVGDSPACYMYTYTNDTMRLAETKRGNVKNYDSLKIKPKLPLLKEITGKFSSIKLFLQHIGNALLYIIYDVPLVRRVPLR